MSATMPGQTLTLRWATYTYRIQRWLLWTSKESSQRNHDSSFPRKLRAAKTSFAVCWCYIHLKSCICRGRPSRKHCALREWFCVSNWSPRNRWKAVSFDSLNSRAVYRAIYSSYRSIAIIIVSSLAGVHRARWTCQFQCALGFTHPVSRRRCASRRNALAPGRRGQEHLYPCISVSSNTDTKGQEHVALFVVCVCYDWVLQSTVLIQYASHRQVTLPGRMLQHSTVLCTSKTKSLYTEKLY
jgi:hypothetical protein